MRRMVRQPRLRARAQLTRNVRALPRWSEPVGDGARRVTPVTERAAAHGLAGGLGGSTDTRRVFAPDPANQAKMRPERDGRPDGTLGIMAKSPSPHKPRMGQPKLPRAAEKLDESQVRTSLESRAEWSLAGEAIQRTYAFKNFVDAIAFVNRCAAAAEAVNHHPDILIRYNKVTMTLSTHDAGGITKRDFDLAGTMDGLVG